MRFGSSVLVGVSGGVDSMTLADMLLRGGEQDFAVAHCNFHLRDGESDGDEEFVRKWAESNGVVFHGIDFDTVGYAKSRGISIEMAARELRYGWFAVLCRKYGYAAVAIAHNANDSAETLILNLVRGTGLRGICGMQEKSHQRVEINLALAAVLGVGSDDIMRPAPKADIGAAGNVNDIVSEAIGNINTVASEAIGATVPEKEADAVVGVDLTVWRPLLGMTRDMIEGYARSHGLAWREDRTNKDTEYRRNLIRHEVLPLLERLNPSVVKVLNRDMCYFRDAQSVVEEHFASAKDCVPAGSVERDLSVESSRPQNGCGGVQNPDGELPGNILSCIEKRQTGWRYALFLYLERFGFSSAVIGQIVDLFEYSKTFSNNTSNINISSSVDSFRDSASGSRTFSGKTFYSPTHRLVTTSSSFVVEKLSSEGPAHGENGPAHGEGETINGVKKDSMQICEAGIYELDGVGFKVEIVEWSSEMPLKQPDGIVCFDYDKSGGWPLTVRKWRYGDCFCPIGMVGSNGRPLRKKLSDFFTDLKLNIIQKEHILVAAADDSTSEVFAVLGKRIDGRVRITTETKRAVKISLL